MAFKANKSRYFIVYGLTFLAFVPIYYRLFDLQVLHQHKLVELAAKQHNLFLEIAPKRGYIFDRNQNELAISLKVPSIYAVARLIYNKDVMAKKLAAILSLDATFVKERLSRDKSFVWIKRKVTEEEAIAIRALKDPNVNIIYENKRFYPHGELLSHVLGFCNIDNQGLEGLEMYLDQYLLGRSGYQYTKRDARGRKLVSMEDRYIPPVDGYDVTLTIDQYIQHIVETELQAGFEKWHAQGAVAIMMDCMTGRILAMANRPTYDLNAYYKAPGSNRRNRSVTDCFEPGSVFKIVTATAGLQEGAVKLDDTIFCENGEYRVSRSRTLHDVHPYGTLDFPHVIIKSSNIGTVKIAQRLGDETLYRYVTQFGFGTLTHIDLPGEVGGIVHPPRAWSKVSITSIPIGQGVAATALQMVRALSVIANGGNLVTPYIVDEVRDRQGIIIKKNKPIIKQAIVQPEIASAMRDILVRVVEEGTGKNAMIEGVKVAGKTGTAQKTLEGKRGYSHSDFISSFMGFVPADKPMFSMIIVFDEPRPLYYGGTVAAPVFKNIAEKTLNYLGYVREPQPAPEPTPVKPEPAKQSPAKNKKR